MVETTTAVKNITPVQYSVIFRQPQIELPSVEELIESRIARLTSLTLATETDLRRLAGHITDRNFAFVPAWPDPLDFQRWMALAEYDRRAGENYLTPSAVKDLLAVPKGPFVMLDVDDGWNRRNIPPGTNRENIKAEGRTPFNVRMGVSYLGDHPYAVDDHDLDLVGSLYDERKVPVLRLQAEVPTLTCLEPDQVSWGRGAPSCGIVVGLSYKKEAVYGRSDLRIRELGAI